MKLKKFGICIRRWVFDDEYLLPCGHVLVGFLLPCHVNSFYYFIRKFVYLSLVDRFFVNKV